MQMRSLNSFHVLLACLAVALLQQGCATGDVSSGSYQAERRAEQLASEGRFNDAAGLYIGLASETTGPERDRLTLLAVEQWLDAGDGRRARSAMAEVAPPSDADTRALWNTNRAALMLWEGKPDEALDILRPMASQPLTVSRRIRVDTLRGDAWFQKNDPVRAVTLYLQLEQGLTDPAQVQMVRERLWAGLLVSDPQAMRASAQITSSAEIRGWLSLGSLAVATGRQGIGWSNGLATWREAYGDHPALTVLETGDMPEAGTLDYPRQLALLLPLSGDTASLGDAIQNGFLAGYYRAAAGLPSAQQIRVYDIAEAASARAAYDEAVEDGAEFIVGPLLRRSVTQLARESILPVPVLSLNYLPDGMAHPPGLFQFALSPEDEAVAAAQRAGDGTPQASMDANSTSGNCRRISRSNKPLRCPGPPRTS